MTVVLTTKQFAACMPYAGKRAEKFRVPLFEAMNEFGITNRPRIAAFLAQIAHESGSLLYVRELASGAAYEGRLDLGNTQPGDGKRFRGRGLIQITGRANYLECSKALYGDDRLIKNPELLEETVAACRSAAWYWWSRGLNAKADVGAFKAITKAVNGGYNGYADRLKYYEIVNAVLISAI